MFVDLKAGMICDFDYIDPVVQGEVLKCFVAENHLLLFPYHEINIHENPESDWTKFVIERTVLVGGIPNIPLFEDSSSQLYWYKANDETDLGRILEHEGITYKCCVVPQGASIRDDCTFVLFSYEHTEYRGEEIRAL